MEVRIDLFISRTLIFFFWGGDINSSTFDASFDEK